MRNAIASPVPAAAATPPRHPAPPAEIAQARVFEQLLQAERGELRELARRLAAEPRHSEVEAGEPAKLQARIAEIDGLLRALQGRFPLPVAK